MREIAARYTIPVARRKCFFKPKPLGTPLISNSTLIPESRLVFIVMSS